MMSCVSKLIMMIGVRNRGLGKRGLAGNELLTRIRGRQSTGEVDHF